MFLVSEAIDISAFTVLGPSLFLELVFVIFIRLNPRSASRGSMCRGGVTPTAPPVS